MSNTNQRVGCLHSGYLVKIPESKNYLCKLCNKQFTIELVKKGLNVIIPEGIRVFLDLKSGDKLQWKLDSNNELSVQVKKAN